MIYSGSTDQSVENYTDWISSQLTNDESQAKLYRSLLDSANMSKIMKGVQSSTPEGGYVKDVQFDESTNTFTFTFDDDSVLVAKISISEGGSTEVDLSKYALKSELESEVSRAKSREDLIESKIPNVSSLATKDELTKVSESIPSLDGYATESYVKDEISKITHPEGGVEYDDTELRNLISTKADSNLVYTKEEIDAKGYLTEHQDISNLATKDELESATDKVVKYSEFEYNGETRKTIQLSNYDTISGVSTSGKGHNLVMLSKWDVADFGAVGVHANINTSDSVTINDNKVIATEDWVASQGYITESYDDSEIKSSIDSKADAESVYTKEHIDTNFATKKELEDASLGDIDLSSYATKDELNAKIAAVSSNLQWKDNVITFDDIAILYPNPTEGDIVYVDDEATTYRYNGTEWVAVSSSSIPVASEESNGLMTSAMFKKLNSLENYDDASVQGDLVYLTSRLLILEDKLSNANKTNIESIVVDSSTPTLSDSNKDYNLSGEVTSNLSVSKSKSVTINNLNINNDARLTMNSDGEVEVKSSTITGEFIKSNGNAVFIIPEAEYITFKDVVFDSTQYNGIEIGLTGSKLAKGISFDNCKFKGKFTNNAVLVHGTADNCVINLSNCYFEDVSNALRISNRTNVRCTVNITNCEVKKWDSNLSYSGFLLCQDNTSSTVDEANSKNLFGDGKVVVNFINLITPEGTKLNKSVESICGTQDSNQVVYVYRNASGAVEPYSNMYPVINVI